MVKGVGRIGSPRLERSDIRLEKRVVPAQHFLKVLEHGSHSSQSVLVKRWEHTHKIMGRGWAAVEFLSMMNALETKVKTYKHYCVAKVCRANNSDGKYASN